MTSAGSFQSIVEIRRRWQTPPSNRLILNLAVRIFAIAFAGPPPGSVMGLRIEISLADDGYLVWAA